MSRLSGRAAAGGGRRATLTLSRKAARCARGRSSPLPMGEGRLRPDPSPVGRRWPRSGRMRVGCRGRREPLQRSGRRGWRAADDPHPFALPLAALSEAQALSQWEQEDLKSHELPNVPKMDINSGSYPIFARGLGLRSDGLARAIWDHLGPLATTVSGTVGGPPGVGSAARTSNFERGEV